MAWKIRGRVACEFAIKRIYKSAKNNKDIQIGYLAVDKKGGLGAYSLYDGFTYALTSDHESKVMKSEFLVK